MILILEVVGPKAAMLGPSARKEFRAGGTIGRLPDNDWVFPEQYVSGHHARISLADGAYVIEDTSSNGLFLNSPQNRIPRGQPYVLQNGDVLFIDDFEIHVTLKADAIAPSARPLIAEDPFSGGPDPVGRTGEFDPMNLLGLQAEAAAPSGPRAAELASAPPWNEHYKPPVATPAPEPAPSHKAAAANAGLIPDDYDPMASAPVSRTAGQIPPPRPPTAAIAPERPKVPRPPLAPPVPNSAPAVPVSRPESRLESASGAALNASRAGPTGSYARPAASQRPEHSAPPSPAGPDPFAVSSPPVVPTPRPGPPPSPPAAARPPTGAAASLDFATLLAAAGLDPAGVSPELAQQFGQILRVVVGGLMDVLRARERIKEEFRVPMTVFTPEHNNPLKFSANVEDALHNLLVKRNAAYLGPVEAFEDAFRDVRAHQMAMLAGLRVAYEAMLAEFEPERLQEEFDRQIKAGALLGGIGKRKYWELYCHRFRDMVKDADASFRRLFGDEFAKAYEEQLDRLKTLNRSIQR